jgi:hypothetical protein
MVHQYIQQQAFEPDKTNGGRALRRVQKRTLPELPAIEPPRRGRKWLDPKEKSPPPAPTMGLLGK